MDTLEGKLALKRILCGREFDVADSDDEHEQTFRGLSNHVPTCSCD